MSLLAMPINAAVLEALASGPTSLAELSRAAGRPSQSTLRIRLRELAELGILTRNRLDGFPRSLDYELTAAGRQLLQVVELLRNWLSQCPGESLGFGTQAARAAINALVDAWSSTMIRALAAKPLTLTELDQLIVGINYPTLERRLGALRRLGQIKAVRSSGPGTPYTVTDWLRFSTAPLAAAARWERLNAADELPPIGRLDIEAAFLLTLPTLELPENLSGSCRLTVETRGQGERGLAGVRVEVVAGRVTSCVTNLEGQADAWGTGSAGAWIAAALENDRNRLELGGDCDLAAALVDGLHRTMIAIG
ncbi:MAG TPA: winged helix-turn-helix transcriptional regulator [Solirubrobacterales bacterium]|nr:winged helix-turn-helix transcriptional regulator [Solirubrobacterales bacterium]